MTAIIGGGLSGLSAAHYALSNPKLGTIVLYEASNRVGGWIQSKRVNDNVTFEQGPRTIRTAGYPGANTLSLIEYLKLNDKIIPVKSNESSAKNRMIYVNNKLHPLPNSVIGLFKIVSPFKRPLISMIWNDLKAPKELKDDESIYNFCKRRLGKDIADNLISSMICGICAGDAKQISVKFLMKTLFEAEQSHGSIMKGMFRNRKQKKEEIPQSNLVIKAKEEKWVLWTLAGGLNQFPRTLADNNISRGLDLKLDSNCEKIVFKEDGVELTVNGKSATYNNIISSLSAKQLAQLVQVQHPELSDELKKIPYVNVAVVNLLFSGKNLHSDAFGFLVPPKENLPILGVIYDSCILPQKSSTVLTVMMGGAWFNKYFGKSPTENEILKVALDHVKQILHIEKSPVVYNVSILKDCIPQYIVGHHQRVKNIQNYISNHKLPLALCGSSFEGVGLNDVILSAKQAVSNIS